MNSIHSYSSVFAVGHPAVRTLTDYEVLVEEKVDGSQFSFAKLGDEIVTRSKGKQHVPGAPDKMFENGVAVANTLADRLVPGWTYRGEYLQKPKHNSLAYARIPNNHVIIFDVQKEDGSFLGYDEKAQEAERIGLEVVPLLYSGRLSSPEDVAELLERESVLGGQKIEGVVIKPAKYDVYGLDKKVLMAKLVSEAFKEVHAGEWKKNNPTSKDTISLLAAKYRTPARFQKAVMHLREGGLITDSPKDIGPLMKEVNVDVLKECSDEIKDALFKWAWPQISRILTAGLPQWYKDELLKQQFTGREGE